MRALKSKVAKMEQKKQVASEDDRRHHRFLQNRMCALLVHRQPGMARVRPEHTDTETYRDIQETLAWARGDYAEAERLADLNPDKHVPPPPGTPWAEWMRLAREALDRCAGEATERTERMRAAVEAVAAAGVGAGA